MSEVSVLSSVSVARTDDDGGGGSSSLMQYRQCDPTTTTTNCKQECRVHSLAKRCMWYLMYT